MTTLPPARLDERLLPDERQFALQLALTDAWHAIDREIAVAGAGGDVAGAVDRWRGLYRQWQALTRDHDYWGA